jgi:hypothetical protein
MDRHSEADVTDDQEPGGSPADRGGWPESVAYDLERDPIRVRDPVAETLGVCRPGQPFEISYADVVKLAGHSCPATAGSYRIAEAGLDALYPDSTPVRGDVSVLARGPPDDHRYGVTSRVVSYVTGAEDERGFDGLAGGFGGRREHLQYEDSPTTPITYVLERADTGQSATVEYHLDDLPPLGEARSLLPAVVDGTVTDAERVAFLEAWHDRVRTALSGDQYVSVVLEAAD